MEGLVQAKTYALGLPDLPNSDFHMKVSQKYSKLACFKGKQLTLNEQAKHKVLKVITSHIDKTNVDSLVKSMSSNSCENFFSQLTKHTEGKRKYLESSLEVRVNFVPGVRSNPYLCTEILMAAGATQSSVIRDDRRARIQAVKERSAALQKKPEYRAPPMYSKSLKLIQVGKDAKLTNIHKSKRMAPMDNVRYCTLKRNKKCGNCRVAGHTKAEYAETEQERPKEKARKGVVSNAIL
jgi:hypothetical protein